MADYWNHNVHYQPLILRAVPPGCGSGLDVGCGDGMLTCRLAALCRDVIGIDRDRPMIRLARERGRDVPNVAFMEGDFLTYPFDESSFDFVCSNTAIHHMRFEAALRRMTRLLRPGGRLAVIGLARNATARDWIYGGAGVPVDLALNGVHAAARAIGREAGAPGLPITNPAETWDDVRSMAEGLLPGARFRRHLLFRYSLTWRKPA
jgi:SAM-dependent methyltransferase